MVKMVIFDFETMIEIQNNQECFVQLWLKLERTSTSKCVLSNKIFFQMGE